jgi:hypothetical protein
VPSISIWDDIAGEDDLSRIRRAPDRGGDQAMDKVERQHRPDLERDAPIRDAMSYVRAAGFPGRGKTMPGASTAADGADNAVAHGVKLGYDVIDDQIRQGQRWAERLRHRDGHASVTHPAEVGTLIERALNIYKDIGTLALEAIETLTRSSAIQSGISRVWRGIGTPGPATDSGTGWRFAFKLTSGRPILVTSDIRLRSAHALPVVHALHAANAAIPPLTGARFEVDPPTMAPVLHVEVADTQPAATYYGVVIDSATNEPCGTLSICILP